MLLAWGFHADGWRWLSPSPGSGTSWHPRLPRLRCAAHAHGGSGAALQTVAIIGLAVLVTVTAARGALELEHGAEGR